MHTPFLFVELADCMCTGHFKGIYARSALGNTSWVASFTAVPKRSDSAGRIAKGRTKVKRCNI